MILANESIFDQKYKIKSLLGIGGMAYVYKAQNIQTKQLVAIKILKTEYTQDAEFVRRFRSEAQAVLNLSQPNIVKLLDIGITDQNDYIVLEYIEGKTLKEEILCKGAFSPQRAIKIATQLCNALSHAHEKNIVHRDVKPQNIILGKDDFVKVTDFGIARFTDASTQTYMGASVMGSVHYISPEQARGENVDQKSDIYSLGIVLYEMLTGQLPFDSDNSVAVAVKHIQEQIVEPIVINKNIGVALNSIVMRATDKIQTNRYVSMKEFAKDLKIAQTKPNLDFVKKPKTTIQPNNFDYVNNKNNTKLSTISLLNIGLIAVVVLGIVFTIFFIITTSTSQNSRDILVSVPQLSNKLDEEARATAQRHGFVIKIRNTIENQNVIEGTVLAQDPKPGTNAKKGSTILIDVSQGAELFPLQNFVGLSSDKADILAKEWGCNIEKITYENSELPQGTVIRQVPQAGAMVENGEAIELWVSGEQNTGETVPTATALEIEQAAQLIFASGFKKVFVTQSDKQNGSVQGVVLNQTPAGGQVLPSSTIITLEVQKKENQDFLIDTAVNLELLENAEVIITVAQNKASSGYSDIEYVVYAQELKAQMHVIPIYVQTHLEGELIMRVYVQGKEQRKQNIIAARSTN